MSLDQDRNHSFPEDSIANNSQVCGSKLAARRNDLSITILQKAYDGYQTLNHIPMPVHQSGYLQTSKMQIFRNSTESILNTIYHIMNPCRKHFLPAGKTCAKTVLVQLFHRKSASVPTIIAWCSNQEDQLIELSL